MKVEIEGKLQLHREDGGMAMIGEIETNEEGDGFFVRLQSWHDDCTHPVLADKDGRLVRVTVEFL